MTDPTPGRFDATAVGRFTRLLVLALCVAVLERSDVRFAIGRLADSARVIHAGCVQVPKAKEHCSSCMEERQKKNLPPMVKVVLPTAITDKRNFRKPGIPTVVCPHCDGETLVNSAFHSLESRHGHG